jgi:hypothetical protein
MPTQYRNMTPEQKQRAHERKKEWAKRNAEKIATYKRTHYYANRDKYLTIERDRAYQKRYGITLSDYDRMLTEQCGKCKICGADRAGNVGQCFAVDHCHVTGRVRGLLCIKCNSRLGWYERHSNAVAGYLTCA